MKFRLISNLLIISLLLIPLPVTVSAESEAAACGVSVSECLYDEERILARLELNNTSFSRLSALLVAAVYESSGAMRACETQRVDLLPGRNPKEITVSAGAGSDSISFFLLETEKHTPIAEKCIVPITEAVPVSDTATCSHYHFAVGKYEMNADGFPAEKYVYDQPLTENDDVLRKWTTSYTPEYIPAEGFGSIPVWQGVREYTGVHIEYNIVDSAYRNESFAAMLAADDLDDICDQGAFFYNGGTLDAIEKGVFTNLYPYKEYMPCYMYETYTRSRLDRSVLTRVFWDKEVIPSVTSMVKEPIPYTGYFVREDRLAELGLGAAEEIRTYEQIHEILTALKTAYSASEQEIYPLFITNNVENSAGCFFSGFDTCIYTGSMAYRRVVNGEVEFCGTADTDREALSFLASLYTEGLISPDYRSFSSYDGQTHGALFYPMSPTSFVRTEQQEQEAEPACRWDPIYPSLRTEGQILHFGHNQSCFQFGSALVSGRCSNVELAVSWLDWQMSDLGSDWTSWGPEGTLWEYNEEGKRQLTDWCLNHEMGSSWCMSLYGCNSLVEFCLLQSERNYAYAGGERILSAFKVLTPADYYDGAYEYPSSVTLTVEEAEECRVLESDLNTYYTENYNAFIDGSKPMSEWESYLAGLDDLGYRRYRELYQEAYDRFMEKWG